MRLSLPLLQFPSALREHPQLLWKLCERDVKARYRGSALGWVWTFLQPLLMLSVYTFVFSEIFGARWQNMRHAGALGFAINIFAGLIVFNIFAETASNSPGLILSNSNYVTKVIFPLEILSPVLIGSACFHAATSVLVLALFELIALGHLPWSFSLLPLVWLPVILGCLGLSWVLAALGTYLRDIGQLVAVAISVLMFLSAVFYPISSLPLRWQPLMHLNPLAMAIEQTRRVAVEGLLPTAAYMVGGTLLALVGCELGFRIFSKLRGGFADVL